MNRRALLVLASLAVVAAVLAIFGQTTGRDRSASGGLVGTRLVPGLAERLGDIERVALVTAGGTLAVGLVRHDDGWSVEQQDAYPANVGMLRDALTALSEASVVEEKTANPDFYGRLGVDAIATDSATGTELRLEVAGDPLPAIILGADSGPQGRFARLSDESTSVLIDRNPTFPTDPTQWLVAELLDVRGDRIRRVDIMHADGETLTIAKPSRDAGGFEVLDIPEGRELQYAAVANVTGNALRELTLQNAATDDTAASVLTTTVFSTFDGLVVTVTGIDDAGETWVRFDAAFDPAGVSVDEEAIEADLAAENGGADVAAEARAINERLDGWRFRIPSHIYDQMTRRMEDLLSAPENATE